MKLEEVVFVYPPVIKHMVMTTNEPSRYDNQGRWCSPPSQLDVFAVSENVTALNHHQEAHRQQMEQLKAATIEKIAELESRVQDAMALMYYTMKYYPNVVEEFRAAEKTKVRIT